MDARINRKEVLHHGRVFDVTIENVTLPNGASTDMTIIRHPGAAAIVPLTADLQVLMLKQYRHAIGRDWWEIPAGTFNHREDPMACAQRELAEETGYKASIWDPLGSISPVPGYSDERIHLFLARDLSRTRQQLDFDEIIEVHALALDQVLAMIMNGQVEDAKTIAAIFRTLPIIGRRISDSSNSARPADSGSPSVPSD
jgi:ADP-ribose pyrophosphatase